MPPRRDGQPPNHHDDYLWIGGYPRVRNGNAEIVSAHWRGWPQIRRYGGRFSPIASGLTVSGL